jgi:hypothetical protein
VIAWLGKAENNSEMSLGMQLFGNMMFVYGSEFQGPDQLSTIKDKVSFFHHTINCVRTVTKNTGWSRRWVLEEGVLAKDMTLFCGKLVVSGVIAVNMERIDKLRPLLHSFPGVSPTFFQLLANNRQLCQTLPHDSMYAPQGLCSDGEDYSPDYGKSATRIFIDLAVKTINDSQNLDILLHCPPVDYRVNNVPRWVPNWTLAVG